MCANCTRAYWNYQDEYNQSMRDGVQGYSFSENEAKKEYDQAVRTCEDEKQEPVAVRDYRNKG